MGMSMTISPGEQWAPSAGEKEKVTVVSLLGHVRFRAADFKAVSSHPLSSWSLFFLPSLLGGRDTLEGKFSSAPLP